MFLFGTANPAYVGQLYRKRWTMEACFQNLQGRGFALRGTQLQYRAKLKKLVGFVSLAYALCVSVGTRLHEKVQPIDLKSTATNGLVSAATASTPCGNTAEPAAVLTRRSPPA